MLELDQRYVLRSLVERDLSPRSAAIFALGYWAGCRVSDIAWLRMEHTHVTRKAGWLHVGHKGGKRGTSICTTMRAVHWPTIFSLSSGIPPAPLSSRHRVPNGCPRRVSTTGSAP